MTVSADQETQNSSENPCSKSDAANFTLTSHLGSKVSVSDYKEKMVVVLFGYTHCPDVCPTQPLYNWYMQNLEDPDSTIDEIADDIQLLIKKGSTS